MSFREIPLLLSQLAWNTPRYFVVSESSLRIGILGMYTLRKKIKVALLFT
jgi:hypothetical protein